jgi:hypothetical protein
VDIDIRGLTLETAQGWWIIIREWGRQNRLPAAPPASSRAPMLAA